jgi:hypothetical protein
MIQQIVCLFVCGIVSLAVASNSKFIKYEFVTLQLVLIAKWLLHNGWSYLIEIIMLFKFRWFW